MVVTALALSSCASKGRDAPSSAFGISPSTAAETTGATSGAVAEGVEAAPTLPPPPEAVDGDVCAERQSGTWDVRPTDADLVELARTASLPRIPLADAPPPTHNRAPVNAASPEEYFSPSTPNREARIAQAEEAGFVESTDVNYLVPPDQHGVRVQKLRDAEGAVAFARAHLGNLCTDPMEDLAALPGNNGLVYRSSAFGDSVVAEFVLGDSEVMLFICDCVPGDRIAIATAWYQRIVDELESGPVSPVV
ncbi:hypothetical protein BH10ACT1_BH10ACT1_18120 [soil metagenome]